MRPSALALCSSLGLVVLLLGCGTESVSPPDSPGRGIDQQLLADQESTTTIGYWYTDWECEEGFVVEYLTTNDREILAESPAFYCDDVMAFDVVYFEAPGAVERVSDGARLTLIEERLAGAVVATYAVAGESETPVRCDDAWPLHERDIDLAAPEEFRLVADAVVSVERPCPSEQWREVVRLDTRRESDGS